MSSSAYQIIVSAMTHTGTVRRNNEDAFQLYSLEKDERLRPGGGETSTEGRGALLIVSDGMGGANAGEVASNLAIQTLIDQLREFADPRPARAPKDTLKLIEHSIQIAHHRILKASLENEEHQGMGATLTLLWLAEDKAWLAQVGDSRLYRLNSETITQVSVDQSPVGMLVRAGTITPEQARRHPQRNLLEQALGAGMSSVHPHCEFFNVAENEAFLLCTDGLSDALSDETIYDFVSSKARWSIPTACKYLINEANEVYGQDNLTVALCRLTQKI